MLQLVLNGEHCFDSGFDRETEQCCIFKPRSDFTETLTSVVKFYCNMNICEYTNLPWKSDNIFLL